MCLSCHVGKHDCAEGKPGNLIPCGCTKCHPEREKKEDVGRVNS